MKKTLILITAVTSLLFSQGEAAVPFLLISPDAHSSGLGESGVTFPETPGLAMHFNVAGLAYQHKYGDSYGNIIETPVNFGYAAWLPNLKLNDLWYFHGATKFELEDIGIFGVSLRYLNLGEVLVTGEDGPDVLDRYDANEFELSVAYSFDIDENQFFGVGLKYIRSGIIRSDVVVGTEGETEPTSPGASVAVDFGYYSLWGDLSEYTKDVRFGVSWNNFGPSITYRDNAQSDPLPIILRGGMSTVVYSDEFSKLRLNHEMGLLTLEQTLKSTAGSNFVDRVTHSTGLEFTYDNTFIVRSGYFHESAQAGGRQFMTVGLGFNAVSIVMDASYLISTNSEAGSKHPLDGTTRFSLRFNL